jgi:hypothetical protein
MVRQGGIPPGAPRHPDPFAGIAARYGRLAFNDLACLALVALITEWIK